jgi:rRNA maturation endonuclease Nob1
MVVVECTECERKVNTWVNNHTCPYCGKQLANSWYP